MGESCNRTLSDEHVCFSRDTWVQTGLANSAPWSSIESYFNATLEFRLSNDSFVPAVGARTAEGDAATTQLLAGLLSDQRAAVVAKETTALKRAWKKLGCKVPYMGFNLLPLSVIPELRLTDKGLIDVLGMRVVPLFE
jgi:hypothetical protein